MTTSTSLSLAAPGVARARPSGARRPLAVLAVAGVAGFFLAAAVSDLLTTGYSARVEAISALAARDAPWAPVMITGFLLLAVGLAAAGVVLWQALPLGVGRAAAVLVLGSATLMAVTGIARQDCSDQLASCIDHDEALGASRSYWVHQYVSLVAFLLLIVGSFLLARALRRAGAARRTVLVARAVAWACLVGTVVMVVGPPPLAPVYGYAQRALMVVMLGWPALVALGTARGGARSR